MVGAKPKASSIAVVAYNASTIEELRRYLSDAGIRPRTARTLYDAKLVPSEATALVLFPDELERSAVKSCLATLRAERPSLLIVVVTSHPPFFRSVLEPVTGSVPPIILPKPALSWIILDAVRVLAGTAPT